MRRLDIIQLVIIIAGIVAAYNAILIIPELLINIIFWLFDGMRATGYFSNMVSVVITLTLYIILSAILVRRSQQLSHYITGISELSSNIKVEQSKRELLFILFIGIGIFNLLNKLPVLLRNTYNAFTDKIARHGLENIGHSPYAQTADFTLPIINVLLSVALLLFAKPLSEYFADKISNVDDIEEIGSE